MLLVSVIINLVILYFYSYYLAIELGKMEDRIDEKIRLLKDYLTERFSNRS
nr:MAG TPA: hypothetical protein [Caudoviricetes sp.]